tara:strand:- start:84 stop:671 length:588 start_codon:yes stop_codon:yes gene_type:complete
MVLPTNKTYRPSNTAIVMSMKDRTTDLPKGWRIAISQYKGEEDFYAYENKFTKERIRWIPLEEASRTTGKSLDIVAPKALHTFITKIPSGIDFEVDQINNKGWLKVNGVDPTVCKWEDCLVVKGMYVTMINRIECPKFQNDSHVKRWMNEMFERELELEIIFCSKGGNILSNETIRQLPPQMGNLGRRGLNGDPN